MITRLQYISRGKTALEHIVAIRHALEAGCTWVQLRMKDMDEVQVMAVAEQVRQYCDAYKARLTVNDYPLVAKAVAAYGLHLGLQDMPVPQARKIVGDKMVIGGTANTFLHVQQRCKEGVDYIGLGPYRFTTTKKQLSPVLGIDGYRQILDSMKSENLNVPVLAIGGLTMDDIPPLLEARVHGVAISGIITNSKDGKACVGELLQLLNMELGIRDMALGQSR